MNHIIKVECDDGTRSYHQSYCLPAIYPEHISIYAAIPAINEVGLQTDDIAYIRTFSYPIKGIKVVTVEVDGKEETFYDSSKLLSKS